MNFKARLNKVLEKLGFVKKFENKSLTSEEYKALCEEYQKEYQSTLVDDLAAENSAAEEAEHQQQINSLYAIVSKANNAAGDGGDNDDEGKDSDDGKKNENSQQPAGASQNVSYEQLAKAVSGLAENVQKMAQSTAPDKPAAHVTAPSIPINGFESNSNYLFGVEHSLFDMKKRWNQITVNPALALASEPDEESDGKAFRKESMAFARSLQQRYKYHQSRNELGDVKALASGQFATNYGGVDNAGLGDQFVILRQDALIARILELRNLTEYFPVRYGVQDRDVLFNAFFDEVSQGYQPGEIYKGGMQLENEMGYVDDAMIKVQFGPMKEIERKYIAYLNKEGSDPIKWSMIEFCLLNLLKKAQDEQNQRRMRGIYVKPEEGQPSSYLNAGTGIWYTLLRYIHDYSIKPFANKSYNTYTSANMLDAVKEFITDVKTHLTEGMTLDKHVLYLNENHIDWWLANCRETYGKDLDFTGPDGYKNRVPDSTIQIKWLPYEGKSCWIFLATSSLWSTSQARCSLSRWRSRWRWFVHGAPGRRVAVQPSPVASSIPRQPWTTTTTSSSRSSPTCLLQSSVPRLTAEVASGTSQTPTLLLQPSLRSRRQSRVLLTASRLVRMMLPTALLSRRVAISPISQLCGLLASQVTTSWLSSARIINSVSLSAA